MVGSEVRKRLYPLTGSECYVSTDGHIPETFQNTMHSPQIVSRVILSVTVTWLLSDVRRNREEDRRQNSGHQQYWL